MTYIRLWCEMCFKKPTCWNDKFSKLYIDLHLVHYLVHLLIYSQSQVEPKFDELLHQIKRGENMLLPYIISSLYECYNPYH